MGSADRYEEENERRRAEAFRRLPLSCQLFLYARATIVLGIIVVFATAIAMPAAMVAAFRFIGFEVSSAP